MLEESPISLPSELERTIFEIAFYDNPGSTNAVGLMLVARRAHIWIEPLLYRIIRVSDQKISPPLYTCIDGKKSLDIPRLQRIGPHVRHVLMQNRLAEEIAELLECCSRVEDLALWTIRGGLASIILAPILHSLPLKRLSFDPSSFFVCHDQSVPVPFCHAMFRPIRHLEIINMTLSWTKWHKLTLLSNLSHLTLAGSVSQELAKTILSECPSLEKLAVYQFRGWSWDLTGEHHDLSEDNRLSLPLYTSDLGNTWERRAREEVQALAGCLL